MVVLVSQQQIVELQSLVALLSSLSLVCSLVIIVTHAFYPSLRSRSAKLVMLLSLSVVGGDVTALAYLGGGSCSLYGLFTAFFLLSSALWSSAIARTISLVVRRNELNRSITRLNSVVDSGMVRCTNLGQLRMWAFYVLVWGIAAVCSLAIAILSITSPSVSSWCWYSDDTNSDNSAGVGQLLFFYVPIVASFLYNSWVLGGAQMNSCFAAASRPLVDSGQDLELELQQQQDALSDELRLLVDSLRLYVIYAIVVMATLCLAELVNLTVFPMYPSYEPHFWLYFAVTIVLRGQGIFNLVVYALRRPDVRQAWRATIMHSVFGRPLTGLTEDACGGDEDVGERENAHEHRQGLGQAKGKPDQGSAVGSLRTPSHGLSGLRFETPITDGNYRRLPAEPSSTSSNRSLFTLRS
jgi:hypothetical protein